jgi:large subunit ribosomal protein L3
MTEAATNEKSPAPSLKAILGQKVGMTQIFDARGNIIPVTVVQAGPCHVTQVLSQDKHGYAAIQVCFGDVREKNVNKPSAGIFKKANVPLARWLREFRTTRAGEFQVGHALRVDAFEAGDFVDVRGLSKGHGFAGSVKRHNFGGGPTTHGQSDRTRAPGSSGSNTYPGRVFKGKKFPGHFGVEQTTVQHLEIVRVIPEKDLLFIRGAVPGPKESLISIEQTVKRLKKRVEHAAEPGKKGAKKEAAKPAAPAKKGGK